MQKIIGENNKTKYCFFDAETENLTLHEINNKPWQMSFVIVENTSIIKEYDYFIKWPEGLNVSAGAARATRFDPAVIEEKGVPPESIFEILDKELNDCDYVAGHNVIGFDAYMIMAYYRKLGKKPFNIYPKVLDTLCLAKAWKLEVTPKMDEDLTAWQLRLHDKRLKGHKLSLGALGKELGVEHDYETLHNALSDLRLNVKVFNKLRKFFVRND